MRRVAVYAGTRNVYKNMVTAAKSLLIHTRVDRVIFLIEDDTFPEWIPPVIECLNISSMAGDWFNTEGPNYNCRWTYMTLIRLALPELLPDEDRVLWLDIDTIVNHDIGELFDMDLRGNLVAMAEEPSRSKNPFVYHNAGVLLMDLEHLRDNGLYLDMIDLVNRQHLGAPDQDAINLLCQTRILDISPVWNASGWTGMPVDPYIRHYAAERDYTAQPLWKHYEKCEWEGPSCQC